MPDVVVIMEVGRGASNSAATVERIAESSVPEIERYEVNVLVISHVEYYSIRH